MSKFVVTEFCLCDVCTCEKKLKLLVTGINNNARIVSKLTLKIVVPHFVCLFLFHNEHKSRPAAMLQTVQQKFCFLDEQTCERSVRETGCAREHAVKIRL